MYMLCGPLGPPRGNPDRHRTAPETPGRGFEQESTQGHIRDPPGPEVRHSRKTTDDCRGTSPQRRRWRGNASSNPPACDGAIPVRARNPCSRGKRPLGADPVNHNRPASAVSDNLGISPPHLLAHPPGKLRGELDQLREAYAEELSARIAEAESMPAAEQDDVLEELWREEELAQSIEEAAM